MAAKSAVEIFRDSPRRPPLHPLERSLVATFTVLLAFQAWALGSAQAWSQVTGLLLAFVAFGLALAPRESSGAPAGPASVRLHPWSRLARSPLFWLGLAFLLYVATGACNPARALAEPDDQELDPVASYQVGAYVAHHPPSTALTEVKHVPWLPAGLKVPFRRGGPWRMLAIYATAWLALCAAWIGLTRRKAVAALFTAICVNGFLIATVGILQRATGSEKFLGLWEPPKQTSLVGSFVYKNHAGAYLNLVSALCFALAAWHHARSAQRLDKSSPAGLFAFFGVMASLLVCFSYSRTATVLLLAMLPLMAVIFVARMSAGGASGRPRPFLPVLLAVGFIAFVCVGVGSLRTAHIASGLRALGAEARTLNGRTTLTSLTLEMARDQWVTGWGSGAFPLVFPRYQQHEPAIMLDYGLPIVFQHAHDDYAELFAEVGAVGSALLLASLACVAFRFVQVRIWRHVPGLFVALGCATALVHGSVDFIFYSPAILTLWAVLLIGTIRWIELDEFILEAARNPPPPAVSGQ